MMENLLGLPHSHTPALTPITPSDFLPVREKIFYYWALAERTGGHILSIQYFPILRQINSSLSPFTIGGHILSIQYFPIFCCYYSLSGQLLQVPRQASFTAPYLPRCGPVPAPTLAAAPPAQATTPLPFRQVVGTSLASADPENPSPH